MRLLIVEDSADLASALHKGFAQHGFVVDVCADGAEALELALTHRYAVIVLDRLLPGMDGLEVCRELRRRGSRVPVLMLTARDAVDDRIEGLDAGADDYVVKPFEFRELLARTRALLRRPVDLRANTLRVGDLCVDFDSGSVTSAGTELVLSRKELLLLTALLRTAGRVVTHGQLLEQAWDLGEAPGPEVVRAHIKNLRRKLTASGDRSTIETVHGVGYRLVP